MDLSASCSFSTNSSTNTSMFKFKGSQTFIICAHACSEAVLHLLVENEQKPLSQTFTQTIWFQAAVEVCSDWQVFPSFLQPWDLGAFEISAQK